MTELHLFPDERVVIQAAVYVAGLACAHFFLVKPLLTLHQERQKRTSLASQGAESEQARIAALEKQYSSQMNAAKNEANDIRNKEVLAGQASAAEIIAAAQDSARAQLDSFKEKIEVQLKQEKAQVNQNAKIISAKIVERLNAVMIVLISVFGSGALLLFSSSNIAHAAGGGEVDFWYGIFWPTFQFCIFAFGMIYFGRGAVEKMLEAKRDTLRTQLSEAKQSVQAAQRKIAEYEVKISSLKSDIENIRKSNVDEGLRQRQELIEEAHRLRSQILIDAEKRQNDILAGAGEALKKDLIEETMKAVQSELSGQLLATVGTKLKAKAIELTKNIH